jgi:hypothetical protein
MILTLGLWMVIYENSFKRFLIKFLKIEFVRIMWKIFKIINLIKILLKIIL